MVLSIISSLKSLQARVKEGYIINDHTITYPEALKIYDMIVVGYAHSQPIPKIIRDLNDIVHYDNCGVNDFRTDDVVAAYARITNDWCMKAH